ncbi:hypothetical protein ACA910_016942 [Epithemia clementina (nom. ined.)]
MKLCWMANSYSANPQKDSRIDEIMNGLLSPAPQSLYVIERALGRLKEYYRSRSSIHQDDSGRDHHHRLLLQNTLDQCQYLVKKGFHFCVSRQFSGSSSCCFGQSQACTYQSGVDWTIRRNDNVNVHSEEWEDWFPQKHYPSTKRIADKLLEHVLSRSQDQNPVRDHVVDSILDELDARLNFTLGTDIRGRTSVDTAFALALAGVTSPTTFDKLLCVAHLELERIKGRTSSQKRTKDIRQMVERIAASGMTGRKVQDFYKMAKSMLPDLVVSVNGGNLQDKNNQVMSSLHDESPSQFNLLSPRPLLWLWRFSARLSKVKEKPANTIDDAAPALRSSSIQRYGTKEWMERLDDTSRPLVVDIGCGFGSSLIGLASRAWENVSQPVLSPEPSSTATGCTSSLCDYANLSHCNFVGGDLSQIAIRYGNAIAQRWGLMQRLQFCYISAESLLDQILDEYYPGEVALILIQFPSPYRLSSEKGNSQLPSDPSSGFMITETLMAKVCRILTTKFPNGRLLIQSNCEDIAVIIRNMAIRHGLENNAVAKPVSILDLRQQLQRNPIKRTNRWIELGGQRACGPEWSSVPLLPPKCWTETEVSCYLSDAPVHRCVMQAKTGSREIEGDYDE